MTISEEYIIMKDGIAYIDWERKRKEWKEEDPEWRLDAE